MKPASMNEIKQATQISEVKSPEQARRHDVPRTVTQDVADTLAEIKRQMLKPY